MTDDPIDGYLWDRSGDADPQVQRLEDLLARFRRDVARLVRGEDEDADQDRSSRARPAS